MKVLKYTLVKLLYFSFVALLLRSEQEREKPQMFLIINIVLSSKQKR